MRGLLALFFRGLDGARDLVLADLDQWKKPLYDDALLDDGFELVVDDVAGIDLFMDIAGDDGLGEFKDAAGVELFKHAEMIADYFDGGLALANFLRRVVAVGWILDRLV